MLNFGAFEGKIGTKMPNFGIFGDKIADFGVLKGKMGTKMPDLGILEDKNVQFGGF